MIDPQKKWSQYAACLVALNRHDELEKLAATRLNGEAGPEVRYYLGLSHAWQGKLQEALQELEFVLAKAPAHQSAKALMFDLLIHQAALKKRAQDWDGITAALSAAIRISPDTPQAQKALLHFQKDLPLSYLNCGKREEAAKVWEKEFKENSKSHFFIHNLALLYYWWATKEEEQYKKEEKKAKPSKDENEKIGRLNGLWDKAISYWVLLLNHDEFWAAWKTERAKSWNVTIDEQTVKKLQQSFFEEKFISYFQNNFAWYKQNGLEKHALRQEEYLNTALLESRSSQAWSEALRLLGKLANLADAKIKVDVKALGRVNLPAGVRFFQEANIFADVQSLILLLQSAEPDNQLVRKLKLYFSPEALGKILVLIEDRKNPEQALAEIEKLPKASKESLEGFYLRACALIKKGDALCDKAEIEAALKEWAAAMGMLTDPKMAKLLVGQPLRPLLDSLKKELEQEIAKVCEKEATGLQKRQKLAEAIQLLERAVKITNQQSLKEHLAILYCDRGEPKLVQKAFAAAREDYYKALEIYPNYERGKQRLATAYNNEALEKSNADEAISLLEKALQYDPNSVIVKQNLADAYNRKGVQILNSLGGGYGGHYYTLNRIDEAIGFINRALMLINPAAGQLAEKFSYADDWTFNALVQKVADEQTKLFLQNLRLAYIGRRNLRGY
jgi:tetratricopeptide (TPR) repeat protein